jgi:Phosphatidylserine synthase
MNHEKPELWTNVHQASKIYFLPNLFTAGNLFFGFASIVLCMRGRFDPQTETILNKIAGIFVDITPESAPGTAYYVLAVLCILMSVLCDALDGRVARASGKSSLFGKEFDSIADAISFAAAPCILTFLLILDPAHNYSQKMQGIIGIVGWFVAFMYLLCGCVRLARFNVLTCPYIMGSEKYEKGDFCGLPVPAAAGAVSSIALTMLYFDLWKYTSLIAPLILIIAFLMVSNIPYPSFKHIKWTSSARIRSFVILVMVLFLLVYMGVYSFTVIFLAYIFYAPLRYLPKFWKILQYMYRRKFAVKK